MFLPSKVVEGTRVPLNGTLVAGFRRGLLGVTVVALGRSIHLFVAALAGVVGIAFVDLDLGRFSLVTFGTVGKFLLMGLVIEGHRTFLVLVGDDIGRDGDVDSDESQQHHDQNQSLHCLTSL